MVILGDCGSLDSGSNLGPGPYHLVIMSHPLRPTMYRTRDHLDVYRDPCIQCGRCREVCPSYRHGGCDPMAVMAGDDSKVFDCLGCGSCTRECGITDPKTVMLAAYSIMLDRPVSQAFLDTGLARYPVEDAPGSDLVPGWGGDDVYVMPGCTVRCVVPYVEYAAAAMMRGLGVNASELPGFTCCMYPIQFGVMDDAERDSYRTRMGETAGDRDMVTLCAGCSDIMSRSGVRCEHVISFVHRHIDRLPRAFEGLRVSLEPGCAAVDLHDEMREVASALGCVDVCRGIGCCGKNSRKVAAPLMAERQGAAVDADLIVVGCPSCLAKYDAYPGGKPCVHIAELVAAAFGDRTSLGCHGIPVTGLRSPRAGPPSYPHGPQSTLNPGESLMRGRASLGREVGQMAWEGRLNRIDDNRWEIPMDESSGMRTNAVIYASEDMIPSVRADNAPQQVANVACLPGIVGSSMAMPDIHWGYGFPIGGVAAVDADTGSISPGGIGFDINCGVRLIRTDLTLDDLGDRRDALVDELYANVPSGLGSKGLTKVGYKELDEILLNGSEWAVENGYGWEDDLDATEEHGRMADADPSKVSDKSRKRGLPQLGSLGSGNHFLELDVVDRVFDEQTAKAFGLREGTLTVTVHCGSRGCGHQIATDYLQEMERYVKRNSVGLPDRQLACAPLDSQLGEDYYEAMCCGANYAWANRQMITHWVRESFERVLGDSAESMGMSVVYDVAHNIAKKERHDVDRHAEDVLVHRKGATRAFAPGRAEVPIRYRDHGQPVIIPGDMSVGTYVLAGRRGSMEQTFGSSCHGAGRRMSRKAAVSSLTEEGVRREMSERGVYLRNGTLEGVLEEAPEAYKDVDEVVRVVCDAGLTAKVAKLRPIGVIKGRCRGPLTLRVIRAPPCRRAPRLSRTTRRGRGTAGPWPAWSTWRGT